MFRVPPSPFHLGKSSFQPVVANPIKLPSRRRSNTSSEPARPLSTDQPLSQGEVISESEPESYSISYRSTYRPSHVVVKSAVSGTAKDFRHQKGGKHAENAYENSNIETSLRGTDEESVIEHSFNEAHDTDTSLNPTRTIITPPPTATQKRKRHSFDESRKRKKLRNLDLPDLAKNPEQTSPKKVNKDTPSLSQEIPIDNEFAAERSTILSERERKEERRRRKEEIQKRKAERRRKKEGRDTVYSSVPTADTPKYKSPDSAQQKMKIRRELEGPTRAENDIHLFESQTERMTRERKQDATDCTLLDAEEPESQIPDSPQRERKILQESDLQFPNEDDFSLPESQKPEMDIEVGAHQGKPSRKKNQSHHMEIPPTQDLQHQGDALDSQTTKKSLTTIEENSIPLSSDSNVQKSNETPGEIQKTQKRNAKPVVSNPKPTRQQPKSPRAPAKQRKALSKERIVDSSAEDDESDSPEDDESQQVPSTSRRRKVGDLAKLRTFIRKSPGIDVDDSEEKEIRKAGQRRLFSTKEDERLRRIVTQYKEREGVSDDEFLEELKSRNGESGIKKDLELENWSGRKISVLIRRIRKLYSVLDDQLTSKKGPYSPEENAVVDNKVTIFLKVRRMDKSEFPLFMAEDTKLNYWKRETRNMCEEIANHLEGRDILSVTRHILKRYAVETFPGEWTAQDDATLKNLVAEKGKQWTVIAEQMGRDPDIVRLRYRDYVSLGPTRKAGVWKPAEAKNLYQIVIEMLEKSEWPEDDGLDYEVVSKYIDWGAVSKKIGDRSRVQCKDKWRSLYKWHGTGKD